MKHRGDETMAQMPLAGLGSAFAGDRLFFAVFPDPATAGRIHELAAQLRLRHGLRGRLVDAARLHVTLHHLGDHAGLPDDLVAAAKRAGDRTNLAPFDARFDRVGSFTSQPRNRPFVLRGGEGLADLATLQGVIGTQLVAAGLARHVKRAFTPHVTLLYDDLAIGDEAIEPVHWPVRELVLVHSLLGQHAHIPLARWPLGA